MSGRVLVLHEGPAWVAQLLEHDMVRWCSEDEG